jgi:hypothetical protein
VVESCGMKKDTRLTFRVKSELKKKLEVIADHEGRSVAQICEAFLEAGSDNYKKEGSRVLLPFISKTNRNRTLQ